MTTTAEVGEFSGRLADLLKQVAAGNEVLLTQGNKPVARLVPPISQAESRQGSVRKLAPLSGKWIGEAVIRSGDLAEEMFERK